MNQVMLIIEMIALFLFFSDYGKEKFSKGDRRIIVLMVTFFNIGYFLV
ncbi:hypothetical protein M2139_001519 [Enterococcus sp. PF1-24]|nr:hypothetical protein [Enterococcus sp. PFB1-1]MDH6401633.1 hypothetical protein [Enterococcus sp. PF1-24]